MKPYLWYSKSTSVTGKELGERLQIPFGQNPPNKDITHCICWGARVNKATLDNRKYLFNILYLNPIFIVESISNKLKALQIMRKNDVSVPDFWNLNEWFTNQFLSDEYVLPLIVRNVRHSGGKGFKIFDEETPSFSIINTVEEANSRGQQKYIMDLIKADREYRVHIFKGRIIRITRKFLDEDLDEDDLDEYERIIKAHDNGWIHKERNISKVPNCVKEEALQAVKALKLDFGGVDVLFTRTSTPGGKVDRAYVLEVNTGCGLSDTGLELYANLFREWLEVEL